MRFAASSFAVLSQLSWNNAESTFPSNTTRASGVQQTASIDAKILTKSFLATRNKVSRRGNGLSKKIKNILFRKTISDSVKDSDMVECDPTHADTGILSCGPESYCMESQDTDLGGVCVENYHALKSSRFLQSIDNNETASTGLEGVCSDQELNCDCSRMDFISYKGTISCTVQENYCVDIENTTFCYDLEAPLYILSPTDYSVRYCYTFSQPYYQSVCYGYSSSSNEFCTVTFNSVDCIFCNVDERYGGCLTFDCSNTEGRHRGSTCGIGGYAMKILQSTLESDTSEGEVILSPHPFCNVCGEGNVVTNTNTLVNIPNQPEITCSVLDQAGRAGQLTEVRCESVKESAADTCGCEVDPNPSASKPPSTLFTASIIFAGIFLIMR